MDESGNSGEKSDPNQPIHLLGCMIVDASNVNKFEAKCNDIAKAFFPNEWKSVEFKAHEIYAGKGPFKQLRVEQRIDLTTRLLTAATEHAAGFGYTGVDKRKSYANDHPHRIAFGLMIEGIQPFCNQRDELGLIIADEYNEIGKTLLSDFSHMKIHGTFWGYRNVTATNIVDTIHFVNSADNRLIQVCDLMTYFTLAEIRLLEGKFEKFFALSDPKPVYSEWLEEQFNRAEIATLALAKIAAKPTRFRAKIFP